MNKTMLAATLVALSPVAMAQTPLVEIYGREDFKLSYRLVCNGDVNADRYRDIVVPTSAGPKVLSGREGVILVSLPFDRCDNYDNACDMDLDGYADVICGDQYWPDDLAIGRVLVISGRDSSELYGLDGNDHYDYNGTSSRWIGDVDADGYPDMAIGIYGWDDPNGAMGEDDNSGKVTIISGKTWAPIFDLIGQPSTGTLGYSCGPAGDMNKDGHADLLASNETGFILVSGKDGSTIHEAARPWIERSSLHLHTIGDLDLDTYPDFLVPTIDMGAAVYSGNGLAKIRTLAGSPGLNFEFPGDMDGDGFPETAYAGPSGVSDMYAYSVESGNPDYLALHGRSDIFSSWTYSRVSLAATGNLDGHGFADLALCYGDSGNGQISVVKVDDGIIPGFNAMVGAPASIVEHNGELCLLLVGMGASPLFYMFDGNYQHQVKVTVLGTATDERRLEAIGMDAVLTGIDTEYGVVGGGNVSKYGFQIWWGGYGPFDYSTYETMTFKGYLDFTPWYANPDRSDVPTVTAPGVFAVLLRVEFK